MGKISKTSYLGVYTISAAAGIICLLGGLIAAPPNLPLIIAGAALILAAKLTFLLALRRAWSILNRQDNFQPKLTANRAVLPLLIPLFNLYWQFRALPGLAAELERYAAETKRSCSATPSKRARLICLLTLIPPAWPALPVLAGAIMSDICDAINSPDAGNISIQRPELPDELIEIKNLTRRYGRVTAVDDISFTVRKGEVVGFLGPNGAGKTTTMRIITGYMPATAGTVKIGGHDIFHDSLAARRLIGYMPEGVAIYPEMRVIEYLKYRARVKGVPPPARPSAVAAVMERCHINDVSWKLIGHLSKGYRQRVGMADALINDPPILILDEPSIGLDPNQIQQVRLLVRELGEEHTVLLSTHILPEVEAVCERVILIHRGRIALDTPVESHRAGDAGFPLTLHAIGPRDEIRNALIEIPEIEDVRIESSGTAQSTAAQFEIIQKAGADSRAGIFTIMSRNNWPIIEMTRKRNSLEELFTRYTTGDEAAMEEIPGGMQ